jgi:hypothetical protein
MGPARWAWKDELRAWSKDKIVTLLRSSNRCNREDAAIWATMMLEMGQPNSIFTEIHGNLAITTRSKFYRNDINQYLKKLNLILRFYSVVAGRKPLHN